MFKWLRRLVGNNTVPQTVNIHITGELKLNYEGRPGDSVAPSQGLVNINPTPKAPTGVGGGIAGAEPDIKPEFFADTGTPEVSFGIDSEEPPKGSPK